MKALTTLSLIAALLLVAAQPNAGSQALDVERFEQQPEPYRTRDESGQFDVSLSVEPLAGQTLVAGSFSVTLGLTLTPPPDIFSDGYEHASSP